jgi:uncharacterized protein YkwD
MYSLSVPAQEAGTRPQAILVDQIGGKPLPLKSLRVPTTSTKGRSIALMTAELRAFELMNAERQINGLRMIEWDDELANLARLHALNMAEQGFFSHRGLDGSTVDIRAKQLGINWIGIGENIAAIRGHDDPAVIAVDKWMNSSSHKKNILNGQWQISAIGAVEAPDGTVYFTQVFLFR